MTKQIVFTDPFWQDFMPLSLSCPVAEMKAGILNFSQRWEKLLKPEKIAYSTRQYLQKKFPKGESEESLYLNPSFLPTKQTIEAIEKLKKGEKLTHRGLTLAFVAEDEQEKAIKETEVEGDLIVFRKHTDLFFFNEKAIEFDFELLTKGRKSQELSPTNGLLGERENLFIEEGASVEFSTINCKGAKIYIGQEANVMEGSHLRGSIAICQHSTVNMGAKIYGATTIGEHSKVGGELNNVVIFGYSNKGHDGFVGNSVIGRWCNLGADTNTSNLKNNYSEVKLWSYRDKKYENSGLQFCGLIMADHSKSAINTQFNTGTVVGVAANIFCCGFPPKHIECFSWGGEHSTHRVRLNDAFETAQRVMSRRDKKLSREEMDILEYIFNNYQ